MNTSLPLNREVIFYPIKVFSSLSHDDSSFVGASDVSQISVPYEYVLCGVPGQGQTLDVYQRPDYWVRSRHILRCRLATSLPYHRTAGPNAGLHVPTYVLGIGQTDTSGSTRINRYSLWKSPQRASFRVVHSKSHKNPFWCCLANPICPSTTTQKVVNFLHPDPSTPPVVLRL